PDELWRNVVPENILRSDMIALQRYREIQKTNGRKTKRYDNIPQIREEDVEVIDNIQQIVVGKQPPPLQQQNEDRNMDP
ncbi:2539_t:CDS:2, partial [Dentiscutata erythropus]